MNNYIIAPVGIMNDHRLGSKHVMAYLAMTALAESDGTGETTVGMLLVKFQKINSETIHGLIDYLERCGWITIYSRGDTIKYRIHYEPGNAANPDNEKHRREKRYRGKSEHAEGIIPTD